MSKLIKFFSISLIISSLFIVQTSSALLGDAVSGNNIVGPCLVLKNNLIYGDRDSQTNGEVTQLQTFLHDNGYLTVNPTGFFGVNTKSAVRVFQIATFKGVKADGIDNSIVSSSSDRQALAETDYRLNNTGYVGMYTRSKIAYFSCLDSGNLSDNNSNTNNNPDAPTFTRNSNTAGLSPLYAQFKIGEKTKSCLSDNGYSVDFGDGQSSVVYPNVAYNLNSAANNNVNGTESCAGYLAYHTYAKAGTYTAKLMKSNCPAGAQCFVGPLTVATLTVVVEVNDTTSTNVKTNTSDLLQGPSTCTVPTYDSSSYTNSSSAANGTCEITLTWPTAVEPLSSSLIKWQLAGSDVWSGNITLADDSLASKSKTYILGQSGMTVVISSNGKDVSVKNISGVCADGASRDLSDGRCIANPVSQNASSQNFWSQDPNQEGAPLVITTESLPNANSGTPYTGTISSTGGVGKHDWVISGGTLPLGMELKQLPCVDSLCPQNLTVRLIGSPSSSGSYSFTVTVKAGTESVSKQFTIFVPRDF